MKEKIKILIADDNIDFVSTLITYFSTQEDVEVIATAKDGQEAYNKIITEKPITLNEIYRKSSKNLSEINNILLMLELDGNIKKTVGGYICILEEK